LNSRSRALLNTWSSGVDCQVSNGAPFRRNHLPEVAAIDLFVIPTIGFDLLYAFIIIRLDRRDSSGSTSLQIRQQNGSRVS
jgi:hypothetical protein